MKPKLSDLWRWKGAIERGPYFFWGVLLAAIKFNLDRTIAAIWFDKHWTVFDPETLAFYLWQSPIQEREKSYFLTLLIVSLPFLWAGTALTLRRLRSLGWRPFWVLLFFVPVVKFILFAILSLLHSTGRMSRPPASEKFWNRTLGRIVPLGALSSALLAIAFTAVLSIGFAWLGTSVFEDYGWTIFVGLPFCMGFLSSLIYSFRAQRSLGHCFAVANGTVLLVGIGLLLFALEGVLCLIMAAPIAFVIATIGGAMGYAVQRNFWWREQSPALFCSTILLLPIAIVLEHKIPPGLPLIAVKSSVVINAPPEKVWANVIAFSELPPPKEMIFKLGIAYPIRAEISGCGVGAVRHCNFSTGPFVEPIEIWDEPRLLKFSVTKNPEPMQEWTPYRDVHPPHLDGYLESRAGQFRLEPHTDGRTLLEGTTWYHHRLWPRAYWQFWSDQIIQTIHLRVLNHIKQITEEEML